MAAPKISWRQLLILIMLLTDLLLSSWRLWKRKPPKSRRLNSQHLRSCYISLFSLAAWQSTADRFGWHLQAHEQHIQHKNHTILLLNFPAQTLPWLQGCITCHTCAAEPGTHLSWATWLKTAQDITMWADWPTDISHKTGFCSRNQQTSDVPPTKVSECRQACCHTSDV